MRRRSNLVQQIEAFAGVLTGTSTMFVNFPLNPDETTLATNLLLSTGLVMGSVVYPLLGEKYFPNFSVTQSIKRLISPGLDYSKEVFFEKGEEKDKYQCCSYSGLTRVATVHVTDLSKRQTRKYLDYMVEEGKRFQFCRGFKITGFNSDQRRFVDIEADIQGAYSVYSPAWKSYSAELIRKKANQILGEVYPEVRKYDSICQRVREAIANTIPTVLQDESNSLLIERPY